jgi:hypothetical protein
MPDTAKGDRADSRHISWWLVHCATDSVHASNPTFLQRGSTAVRWYASWDDHENNNEFRSCFNKAKCDT